MTLLQNCPHCGRGLPQPSAQPFGLTPRQKVMLDFLRAHRRVHGNTTPSYDEIATAIGLKSKSGVHRLVLRLQERGHIRRLDGCGRSLVPVEASP